MGPPSQQIRVGVLEKWAGRCQIEIATSRPAQIDPNVGREFQMSNLGWLPDRNPPQNAKVVYPPPPGGENQGILDGQPEMSCVWPAKPGLSRSTFPKLGRNEPKMAPKRGQQREKRGAPAPKSTLFGPDRGGGCASPKTAQTQGTRALESN